MVNISITCTQTSSMGACSCCQNTTDKHSKINGSLPYSNIKNTHMKEVIIFSDVGFDLSDNTDDLSIEAVGQLFAEPLSDRRNKIPFNHISCLNLPSAFFFWWLFLDEFLLGFLLMKTENSVRAKDGLGCLHPDSTASSNQSEQALHCESSCFSFIFLKQLFTFFFLLWACNSTP